MLLKLSHFFKSLKLIFHTDTLFFLGAVFLPLHPHHMVINPQSISLYDNVRLIFKYQTIKEEAAPQYYQDDDDCDNAQIKAHIRCYIHYNKKKQKKGIC